MIIRYVRLQFSPEDGKKFLALYRSVESRIKAREGCLHLELWQEALNESAFTTLSHWKHLEDLEAYRKSELFKGVWSQVKPMLLEKALAVSYKKILEK
jgi:quinol monooxygenase YgiN